MDYIISANNGIGLTYDNTPNYSIKVRRITKELLHEINCGEYVSSLLNYHMYTDPILSSKSLISTHESIPDALVIRSIEKSDVTIKSYLERNETGISVIVTMLSNILRFLSSNHITHTNIHFTNVIMNIHNTHPLLGDFSYSIIHTQYTSVEYIPTQYWKCPSYHLFCFVSGDDPSKQFTYDTAIDLTHDIVDTSLGVSLPIHYVTNVSNMLHKHIGQSYQDIINIIMENCYKWDIYSMHVLLYECTNDTIHNDCKQYIIDRTCSLFK